MLILKDCGLEPGDIVLVVSNNNKPLVKIKQFVQSFTTAQNKHGHREVISVFVCTGKNKYGVICHNFEKKLSLSKYEFIQALQEKTVEELSLCLLHYCNKEFTLRQLSALLQNGEDWIHDFAANKLNSASTDDLIEQFLMATKGDKRKLLQLIILFWQASGQYEILPSVNSSLLVFKHTDNIIRKKFLDAYLHQVKISEQLHTEGKNRISFLALLKSLFSRGDQDQKDRTKQPPSEKTFCSSNLMQVLNQIDPDLVNRGRHVLPKTLEAGLREATKIMPHEQHEETHEALDDFESMIAVQEKLLPPFKMSILPAAGTTLIQTLLTIIDREIDRIEHKLLTNVADQKKAADLKALLLPYRDPKLQSYSVNLQIDIALELSATILPTLQRKTGIFGSWISSTSYTNVKKFLRTQGIFDGDLREASEKLKNHSSAIAHQRKNNAQDLANNSRDIMANQVYIFSDWSFLSWPLSKRNFMLEHMKKLLLSGHTLYTWENEQLIEMTIESIQKAINSEDLDDLLAPKLKPATRQAILNRAVRQKIDTTQIQFLDYHSINALAGPHESIESSLHQVASLFASKINDYHLNQIKQHIIDIEIDNTSNENEQARLTIIRNTIVSEKNKKYKTYQSGIDTKAFILQSGYKKAIFKPVDITVSTPSSKYYRDEIYTDLIMNDNPSSIFQYFELVGMNATKQLVDCQYTFHANGFTKSLMSKRQAESKQVLFKGKKNLTLTGEWQALPSLDPNETLVDIAVDGLAENDFQLKFSKENCLYYIRSTEALKEPKDISVDMLLRMPMHYQKNIIFNTLSSIPQYADIHHLLMKYLKYGKDDGKLRNAIDVTIHNGNDYLAAVRNLAVGSCRIRAIAFKEEMKRLHPEIPVSIIVNSDHCFIEMKLDDSWQRYCLGGYRDTLNVVEVVKENSLEICSGQSTTHRFFTDITKKTIKENKYPLATQSTKPSYQITR